MSSNPQINPDNQEIDLSQISKKISSFFENVAESFFKVILFFKRNILIIGILFVIGVVIGVYLDKTVKVYNNQIIVSPNYGSNDYLYDKVNLINSKILDGDTLYLKNTVGIKEPKKIRKIDIKPIIDVYKFIEHKEENFELIKLMAEDGDIKKVINDNVTSKNYPYHEITFITSEVTNKEDTSDPIMKYLNNSKHYAKLQTEYINNIKLKLIANDSIIKQIDGVLNSFKKRINTSANDKLIYFNENTQLNDIIKTKNELVNEQGTNRIQLIVLDKIIKESSLTLNIKNTEAVNGKLKLVLPFLFILIFILIGVFKSFYKRQLAKLKL